MTERYDWIVIGGGFRGAMAAYFLSGKGQRVLLCEASRGLGGVMSSVPVAGTPMDKGPQFLDSMDESASRVLREIAGDGLELADVGYHYSSCLGGRRTDGFVLPDWRSKGVEFCGRALHELIASATTRTPAAAKTFADTLDQLGASVARELAPVCEKFTLHAPEQCAPELSRIVTFAGRMLLLDARESLLLKQLPELDLRLAAPKASLPATARKENLYPRAATMGAFIAALEQRLCERGVRIEKERAVSTVQRQDSGVRVVAGEEFFADSVFFASDLESVEQWVLGTESLAGAYVPLPQIFYYFEAPGRPLLSSHYVMNYQVEDAWTRATLLSNYSGEESGDRHVACVEVPARVGSALWEDPDAAAPELLRSLALLGVLPTAASLIRAFRIPTTYRIPMAGSASRAAEVVDRVRETLPDRALLAQPGVLTRAEIFDELRELGLSDG